MILISSLFSMPNIDNSSGYFESLKKKLPYELEDNKSGFNFIGTIHLTWSLTQNTYQDFIRKEQTKFIGIDQTFLIQSVSWGNPSSCRILS